MNKFVIIDTSEYTLISVTIILISIFWCWIMYMLYKNPPSPKYYLTCNPGQCATNIFNGEKRCADDETVAVLYDPLFEVCNSKYVCDNNQTPYAVYSDGSTDDLGICEVGNICRCVKKPQCSTDTLVTFTAKNDVSSQFSASGSRLIYEQNGFPTQGYTGVPLIYNNYNTQDCMINISYFNIVVPRTYQCSNWVGVYPTMAEAMACINSNPCIVGRLAFKPSNLFGFTLDPTSITTTPTSCMPDYNSLDSKICSSSKAPVWDPSTSTIKCINWSDT